MQKIKLITALLSLILLGVATLARAQGVGELAKYTVHASGFAALTGYCYAKHGPIYGDSPGGKCFNRGKDILTKADLPKASRELAAKCPDTATFSTCMTPILFGINGALAVAFEANRL